MQTDTVTLNLYFSLSTCATIVSKVALYWCQHWFVMDLKSNIFLSCNSCLLDWSLIILSGQLSHSIATRSPSCFMRRVSCFFKMCNFKRRVQFFSNVVWCFSWGKQKLYFSRLLTHKGPRSKAKIVRIRSILKNLYLYT